MGVKNTSAIADICSYLTKVMIIKKYIKYTLIGALELKDKIKTMNLNQHILKSAKTEKIMGKNLCKSVEGFHSQRNVHIQYLFNYLL